MAHQAVRNLRLSDETTQSLEASWELDDPHVESYRVTYSGFSGDQREESVSWSSCELLLQRRNHLQIIKYSFLRLVSKVSLLSGHSHSRHWSSQTLELWTQIILNRQNWSCVWRKVLVISHTPSQLYGSAAVSVGSSAPIKKLITLFVPVHSRLIPLSVVRALELSVMYWPWSLTHTHIHTTTSPSPLLSSPLVPLSLCFSQFFPSLLSSLLPPPLMFLILPSRSPSPPVLISQCGVRAVEDGEARPSQKTFHYLFSSHLPHWEQRWRAAEKRAKETKRGGKKKQQLNKMGERLKPVRRLKDKSCFGSHLFLKVWGFDVDMCERQIEGKGGSWDRVCFS